ncbi:MAG: hypothetical protein GX607_15815 [Myxococcales bacterium]|jgi:hypothetical protein|nr:hypothetical protein [Myxococcales bacterium]
MSEGVRPRLAPIPSAVLRVLPSEGSEGVRLRDESAEPEVPLLPLREARATRALLTCLDPPSTDPRVSLRIVEGELERLFAGHERALAALQVSWAQVRAALEAAPSAGAAAPSLGESSPAAEQAASGASPEAIAAALGSFEELLEALVDRHGLWEGSG